MSIGPALLYDVWKTDDYIFSAMGAIQFNFLTLATIRQSENESSEKEERDFNAYYLTPRMSLIFSKRDVLSHLDLVSGVNVALDLGHTYSTSSNARNSYWWKGKEFERGTNLQSNYFLGLQTDY
jgi:hypothetical protein